MEMEIRPTARHLQLAKPEIKDRFCISKTLTLTVSVILTLFIFKYASDVYRLVCSNNVTVITELGLSTNDDMLLLAIYFFFNTLMYAGYLFRADPSNCTHTKKRYKTQLIAQGFGDLG